MQHLPAPVGRGPRWMAPKAFNPHGTSVPARAKAAPVAKAAAPSTSPKATFAAGSSAAPSKATAFGRAATSSTVRSRPSGEAVPERGGGGGGGVSHPPGTVPARKSSPLRASVGARPTSAPRSRPQPKLAAEQTSARLRRATALPGAVRVLPGQAADTTTAPIRHHDAEETPGTGSRKSSAAFAETASRPVAETSTPVETPSHGEHTVDTPSPCKMQPEIGSLTPEQDAAPLVPDSTSKAATDASPQPPPDDAMLVRTPPTPPDNAMLVEASSAPERSAASPSESKEQHDSTGSVFAEDKLPTIVSVAPVSSPGCESPDPNSASSVADCSGAEASPKPAAPSSDNNSSPQSNAPCGTAEVVRPVQPCKAGPGKAKAPPFKAPGKAPPGKAPPGKAPPSKAGPALLRRSASEGFAVSGSEAVLGPRLKPVHWSAATQLLPGSVWEALAPPAPLNTAELERRFAQPEAKAQPAVVTAVQRSVPETSEQRKRLRILDHAVSQKLGIVFSRLPPPERLAVMIESLEGFPENLPPEAVLALNAAASEQREAIEQLRKLDYQQSDLASLDVPERYLWVLGSVPHCVAKLACGALIVGQARELKEMSQSGRSFVSCCHGLRGSALLRKCISTCLAVGNLMNRGTSRAGVRAVILPDSLMKLDEVRGLQEVDDGLSGLENRAPSLLDFVAQAVVDDDSYPVNDPWSLRMEIEDLQRKVKSVRSISLEDVGSVCRQVHEEATRASSCLQEMPEAAAKSCISKKVHAILYDATEALTHMKEAQAELRRTQEWSSARPNSKSEDWLTKWSNFLDQLAQAFGRAQHRIQNSCRSILVESADTRAVAGVDSAACLASEGNAKMPDAPLAAPAFAKQCSEVGTPHSSNRASAVLAPTGAQLQSAANQQPPLQVYDDDARIGPRGLISTSNAQQSAHDLKPKNVSLFLTNGASLLQSPLFEYGNKENSL